MPGTPLRKGFVHRKQKMKSFGNHEEFLARITKSLYFVQLPLTNYTSLPLTELAAEIFSQANKFSLNRLDVEKAAHYSRNGCVSPSLLVLALLYLERLKSSNPKYLSQVSPSELFLITLLVGSKFLQDDGEGDELSNLDWADLTGLSVEEINTAEKEFLDAINWEVFVSKEEFWKRLNLLETKAGLKEGCKRGWFTYTELNVLLQLIDISNVVQCLWNVIPACLLSYSVSVLALVGSAVLVGQIPGLSLKPKVPIVDVGNVESSFNDNVLPLPHSNRFEDCNAISSSPKFIIDSDRNNSEQLNFCNPCSDKELETNLGDPILLNYFSKLLVHFKSVNFLDFGRLDEYREKYKNSNFIFARDSIIWNWSEFIQNFLLKNSEVSREFYSIASF